MLTSDVEPGDHLVHLYADDMGLASSVADYAAAGLRRGEAFVMIAEPAHRAAVRDALAARGIDLKRGAAAGIHVLDSSATLAAFVRDGRPDASRFDAVVGGAVQAAGVGRTGVRAYGEMVEALWRDGDVSAALALEELWNSLASRLPFSLYCAYHEALLGDGADADADALDEACRLHSAVVADGALAHRSTATAQFDADPGAPAAARHFVLESLRTGPSSVDPARTAEAALVASELATNAVRYGRGAFSVTVALLAGGVRISVRDSAPELPEPRHPSPGDLSGRGLHIVDALSRGWGAAPRGEGKVVWAEISGT